MALNIKVSKFPTIDMVLFKFLPNIREKKIASAKADPIKATFAINEKAKLLHPDFQQMVVDEIIDHAGAGAKTFVLKKADGTPAAFFRAGQYISVLMHIDGSLVTRPYSISSSPALALKGIYHITVRSNPDGFAADKLLSDLKVGDSVTVSDPQGTFYYEELRDEENVIAIAGGSGITPFLSMARAISEGTESFGLTILSGSRNKNSILFYDELAEIAAKCPKVKVVHVLSDDTKKKPGFEKGFITADLIKKYAPEGAYSVFMCGPAAMYSFVGAEIEKLGLDKKHVRRELLGVTKEVKKHPDYPKGIRKKNFTVTVHIGPDEWTVPAKADETVLTAIERAGIPAPSRCRSGECGWCRSKLVSGTVFIPQENDGRRFSDKESGYIHPCASFPTSDLVIEVPGSYMK